jgi:Gas vesicle synthesis protein GvpL/GvpF
MSAVYVYGVLPAAELESLSVAGVQDGAVRAVEHQGLAALASELKDDSLAAAREVRRHWRVLDAVSKSATVLPARFGTVLESDEAVRELLLEPNAERLQELMLHVAGRVQLNLKGEYDEGKLLRSIAESSPAILALRDKLRTLPESAGYYDRIQLGELVAGEVQRRRETDTHHALEVLAPLAVDSRQEDVTLPRGAYKLAFLVERGNQDEFTSAVNRLSAEQSNHIDIRYVGPLPPYSFAEADLTPRSEAWA